MADGNKLIQIAFEKYEFDKIMEHGNLSGAKININRCHLVGVNLLSTSNFLAIQYLNLNGCVVFCNYNVFAVW